VECYPNGQGAARAPVCVENAVTQYPTWRIGGTWYTEILQPDRLAALSNYHPPPGVKP